MSEFQELKEAFTMAEILVDETPTKLAVEAWDKDGENGYKVIFTFDLNQELEGVYIDDF